MIHPNHVTGPCCDPKLLEATARNAQLEREVAALRADLKEAVNNNDASLEGARILSRKLTVAEAELAALKADRDRLDWLFSQQSGGTISLRGPAMDAWCNGADWRAAIDSARNGPRTGYESFYRAALDGKGGAT